jgi:phosphoglycerol transferase
LFATPLLYRGDFLVFFWNIITTFDLIFFLPSRVNYPFGYDFYDFPSADTGLYLLFSFVYYFSSNLVFSVNLLYIFSFILVYVISFCCIYYISSDYSLSLFVSLLYTFTPFHFIRLEHILYTFYILPPIFIVIGVDLYRGNGLFLFSGASLFTQSYKRYVPLLFLFTLFFNVYYVFFGFLLITLALCLSPRHVSHRSALLVYFTLCVLIATSLFLNISGYVINRARNGPNSSVAQRDSVETEIYALKPYTLLLPRADHRLAAFRNPILKLDTSPGNEQISAASGLAGTFGFVFAIAMALRRRHQQSVTPVFDFLLTVFFIFIFIASPANLNSLFALFITPSIRAWNRISIYLVFILYYFFCFNVISILRLRVSSAFLRHVFLSCICLLLIFDQTAPANTESLNQAAAYYASDQHFFKSLEASIPPYSAVYQLPYQTFPESSPIFNLDTYDLAKPLIHTTTTRWTWGGTRGRLGQQYYQQLNTLPLLEQLPILVKLRIHGILINLLGYPDQGASIKLEALEAFKREPDLTNEPLTQLFYRLPESSQPSITANLTQTSNQLPMKAEIPTYIDFRARKLSDAVCAIKGISGWEPT